MKRVMVTGGAGFIGSNLTRRLLDRGYYVLVVDDFSSGARRNVEPLLCHPHFEVMRQDVAKAIRADVEEIYHLACPASPVFYQRDPVHTVRTCVEGSLNVLALAQATNARVLLASTSEVYGDPEVHPQRESYWGHVNPIGLRSCYDEGKRCAETMFFDFHRQYHVRTTVARIFNTYGPGMLSADGRVVSDFIVRALSGRPLTIFGDGSQTRSFCFVDDLVDGLIRLMESPEDVIGPMNLGNPEEHTVAELAETVAALVGLRAPVEFRPLPSDDPRRRRPDITFATETLGWRPTILLEEGLRRTIRYFREELGISQPITAGVDRVVGW